LLAALVNSGKVSSVMNDAGTACVICGGTVFVPGFRGRMVNGKAPACASCHSYERHRIVYGLYSTLTKMTSDWRALQFAPDMSVRKDWFREFQDSKYGTDASLDMMQIELPSGSKDIILSNHVLEHVEDDVRAMSEMLRVTGDRGLVHVTVPSPSIRAVSLDWGFPDPEKNYHWRDYGRDLTSHFTQRIRGLYVLETLAEDAVTRIQDYVYLFSRNRSLISRIREIWRTQAISTSVTG
jgi:SAM-dependent methyltransferase